MRRPSNRSYGLPIPDLHTHYLFYLAMLSPSPCLWCHTSPPLILLAPISTASYTVNLHSLIPRGRGSRPSPFQLCCWPAPPLWPFAIKLTLLVANKASTLNQASLLKHLHVLQLAKHAQSCPLGAPSRMSQPWPQKTPTSSSCRAIAEVPQVCRRAP